MKEIFFEELDTARCFFQTKARQLPYREGTILLKEKVDVGEEYLLDVHILKLL